MGLTTPQVSLQVLCIEWLNLPYNDSSILASQSNGFDYMLCTSTQSGSPHYAHIPRTNLLLLFNMRVVVWNVEDAMGAA